MQANSAISFQSKHTGGQYPCTALCWLTNGDSFGNTSRIWGAGQCRGLSEAWMRDVGIGDVTKWRWSERNRGVAGWERYSSWRWWWWGTNLAPLRQWGLRIEVTSRLGKCAQGKGKSVVFLPTSPNSKFLPLFSFRNSTTNSWKNFFHLVPPQTNM